MKGILGRKIGMTQVFAKDGKLVPVTVVEVEPNVVTQIKTVEKDGYVSFDLVFNFEEKHPEECAKAIQETLSNEFKDFRFIVNVDYDFHCSLSVVVDEFICLLVVLKCKVCGL